MGWFNQPGKGENKCYTVHCSQFMPLNLDRHFRNSNIPVGFHRGTVDRGGERLPDYIRHATTAACMKYILFLSILLSGAVHAQHQTPAERELADRLPERFYLDVPALRRAVIERIPANYRGDRRNDLRNFRFADAVAFSVAELLKSGYVYSDWQELEDLMNGILRKVWPSEMGDTTAVHAYLVRDADMNASMTGAGQMFINIGLIDEVQDETTLAAILCHELAHYHLQHSYQKFREEDTGEYGTGSRQASDRSVAMEQQADSFAMVWHARSGYDITGVLEQFRMMERLERQWELKRGRHKPSKRPTHPAAKERLLAFKPFFESHQQAAGARFLVDEAAFLRSKAACKPEILRVLLQEQQYSLCIRKAFTFHLFQPEEQLYVWYLMEAIRRMCYLNSERWDDVFIMDVFQDVNSSSGPSKAARAEDHLFTRFDMDILCLDPKRVSKIKARSYWEGEVKFRTYHEAYLFFQRLGNFLNCHECELSTALYANSVPRLRDSLLTVYTQGPAQYAEFAQALKDGSVQRSLGSGKLTVFTGITAYIKQGKDRTYIRVASEEDDRQLNRLTDTLTTIFKNRTFISLPDLRSRSLDLYLQLKELWQFSLETTVARGGRTDIHILDPRYIEVFRAFGVNEVEFVHADLGELRAKERDAAALEELTLLDYDRIFDKTEGLRYLDVIVTSIRDSEDGIMKVRHLGAERIIRPGKHGLAEIAMEIRRSINDKEDRVQTSIRSLGQ